jgi:quercetin dioxygenase-like cupin family protein
MHSQRISWTSALSFTVAIFLVLALAAAHAQEGQILFSRNGETLRLLNKVDLGDVAAGKYVLRITEYSMEPGAKIASHVHKGPGLRYVLEGSIAIEFVKGDKIETYHTGSTYFEPAGHHYGGYNAGSGRARVIIVELLPFE